MLCHEIMKAKPECLNASAPVLDAAQRMRDANIGFLPVCGDSGAVVGTITDRDIAVRVVADEMSFRTPVADVMTRGVITCRAEEDVSRAKDLMGRNKKSRIVCVDGRDRPVGVISLSDLAKRGDVSRTLREITSREKHA
jgi:CBS domain-containing protein